MGTDQIMYCVVALILGMLLANMLKNVCGCKKVVEGSDTDDQGYIKCNKSCKFFSTGHNPDCVANAWCRDGKCKCDDGYPCDSDGVCMDESAEAGHAGIFSVWDG
jgi:hypothetical protein